MDILVISANGTWPDSVFLPAALAMALLAVLVLLWWGLAPLTAVLIAIFVSCLAAALYAWWLSRRVLRPLDDAGYTSTEQNLHNNPRRTP